MRLCAVLLVAAVVAAQDRDPFAKVDDVLRAVKANDETQLNALALDEKPGVWVLAHELCARGEFDAALKLAAAGHPKDCEKLPAYIERRRGQGDDSATRAAMKSLNRLLHASQPQRVLDGARALTFHGDNAAEVHILMTCGYAHGLMDRLATGSEAFEVAGIAAEKLGMLKEAALCFELAGGMAFHSHQLLRARFCSERLAELHKQRGDARGEIMGLDRMVRTHSDLGEAVPVIPLYRRIIALATSLDDDKLVVKNRGKIVVAMTKTGQAKAALPLAELAIAEAEKLGDDDALAFTLIAVGGLHLHLNDENKAFECYRRGLAVRKRQGNPINLGMAHLTVGQAYHWKKQKDKAIEHFDESVRVLTEANSPIRGYALRSLAAIYDSRDEFDKSKACAEKAFNIAKTTRDGRLIGTTLVAMAEAHVAREEYEKALPYCRNATQVYQQLQDPHGLIESEATTAYCYLKLDRPEEALTHVRPAVDLLTKAYSGLGDERSALARSRVASVFYVGAAAARKLGDATSAMYYVEAGRAGTLLESLGGRGRLKRSAIPEALRTAEAKARSDVRIAREQLKRATLLKNLKLARASKQALEEREAKLKDVIQRIQFEAKSVAGLMYPSVASLEEIQRELQPGEALVAYTLFTTSAIATVVTAKDARIVELGKREAIDAACEALVLDDTETDPAAAIEALRKLAFEPLGLDASVQRVLVSPEGALSLVPFAALAGKRDVINIPSGTVYRLLRADRDLRGSKVLALGDPEYSGDLERLPHTRKEAKAVGDVELLGSKATKAELIKALGKRKRWRAVHLACHGLIDPEHPTLSSLAITGGRLTAYDVMGLPLAADLVVLSACETGRGKIVRGEGVLGLTRAFMVAGAPRVIVSLWPVEDRATQALMKRFYQLWKGKKLSTAAALRQAQEYVRKQKKWRHPMYWAAWQLWGLPN